MTIPIHLDTIGLVANTNLFLFNAKHKGADQPPHLRSLISAFVISLLEGIVFKLAAYKISAF